MTFSSRLADVFDGEPFVGFKAHPNAVKFEFAVVQYGVPFKLGHAIIVCGPEHNEKFWSDRMAELNDDEEQNVLIESTSSISGRPELTLKINKRTNVISWRVPTCHLFDDVSISCLPFAPFFPAILAAFDRARQDAALRVEHDSQMQS
jgi:hypothetical protein